MEKLITKKYLNNEQIMKAARLAFPANYFIIKSNELNSEQLIEKLTELFYCIIDNDYYQEIKSEFESDILLLEDDSISIYDVEEQLGFYFIKIDNHFFDKVIQYCSTEQLINLYELLKDVAIYEIFTYNKYEI